MSESTSTASAPRPAAKQAAAAPARSDAVVLEVFDPTGAIEAPMTFAKRLDTLAGKRIAQVGNSWEAHRVHPLIKELLEKIYPTVQMIPYTDMPDYTDLELLEKAVEEKECDAVIFGNAA